MSTLKIEVPEFGESIEEATLIAWLKEDGDIVQKDEVVCELESEKANIELVAPGSGTIKKMAQINEPVKVGQIIAEIVESEAAETPPPSSDKKIEKKEKVEAKNKQRDQDTAIPELTEMPIHQKKVKTKQRKLADTETREPMNRFRLSMAKRLVKAQQESAATTTFNDVDLSKVMQIRKELKEEFLKINGVKLGLMSFFVKATVKALQEFPLLNSQIENDDIIKNSSVHMGIAISREKGLVVPVLKNAHEMNYATIEKNILEMAQKAETGKLSISELTGGTFTITNGGVYGSLLSIPLLTPPQVGILGMHRIEYRPVAIKNELHKFTIQVRPMMLLALTYDHRLVEGKEAVQFLNHLKHQLHKVDAHDLLS